MGVLGLEVQGCGLKEQIIDFDAFDLGFEGGIGLVAIFPHAETLAGCGTSCPSCALIHLRQSDGDDGKGRLTAAMDAHPCKAAVQDRRDLRERE